MTDIAIRPAVVALLTDLTPDGHPETWKHDNGQTVTADELQVVLGATWDELEAARDYTRRAADFAAEKVAAINRIHEIAAPYLSRDPEPTPLELMALVSDTERAELAELLDLVAPDGTAGLWPEQ